ncbi:MAG TPA: hypothetical protein VKE70_33230 [Candidatus Solibacter sp.]|nr:hypothetical protein [Candidatus Solibacter sp.]
MPHRHQSGQLLVVADIDRHRGVSKSGLFDVSSTLVNSFVGQVIFRPFLGGCQLLITRPQPEHTLRAILPDRSIGMRYLPAIALTTFTLFAADRYLRDDSLVKLVEDKVRKNQPSRDERRWDLVGWAPDVQSAESAAKKANRPVFLFTYDGNVEIGRC